MLMDTPPSQIGNILLSDDTDQDRPDSGVVLSSGVDWLTPGERVLVPPFAGIWFRDLMLSGYKFWEARFYGVADFSEFSEGEQDVKDIILASVDDHGILKPKNSNVLLRRDPVNDEQSGIILPDKSKYRNQKATVVAVGPDVKEVSPGDRVVYHGPMVIVGLKNLIEMDPTLDGDSADYCLIDERGIYCIL